MEMFRYVRFAGGKMYRNVKEHFEYFWCLFDGSHMIGTAALKKLDEKRYELKSLYLLKKYHKRGEGNEEIVYCNSTGKTGRSEAAD